MIIFDLDGTLSCCEHRRHYVDPDRDDNAFEFEPGRYYHNNAWIEQNTMIPWKPNWKAFYQACEHDKPIEPVVRMWADQISLGAMGFHQIWSGRCASVRKQTEKWLDKHLLCFEPHQLKMRPIGDNTPDDVLKERWLDEAIAEGKSIDFVVDDRPKVVRMWRRRGVFVFDVNQTGKEF